jgi:hypothetical protein
MTAIPAFTLDSTANYRSVNATTVARSLANRVQNSDTVITGQVQVEENYAGQRFAYARAVLIDELESLSPAKIRSGRLGPSPRASKSL